MKHRALCIAASLICASVIQAQTITYTVGQFDSDAAGYFTDQHWGTAVPAITWDGSQKRTESGGRYTIQESSNLLQWTPSLIVTNVLGTTGLAAPGSMTTNPSLFFRATRN